MQLDKHHQKERHRDKFGYAWGLFQHKLDVLARHGRVIPRDAAILDYGCGKGVTVRALHDNGFVNARGYEVEEYDDLACDKSYLGFGPAIPFADAAFDVVVSDQVFEHVLDQEAAFAEIYRVLKPGGVSMHVIPARYKIIEPHILVPLGGLLRKRWWFKLWAKAGIRNQFQDGLTADQVADINTHYSHNGLKYVGNLRYRRLWKRIGFSYRFAERDYMETSRNRRTRKFARLSAVLPVAWAARQVISRIPVLSKPANG